DVLLVATGPSASGMEQSCQRHEPHHAQPSHVALHEDPPLGLLVRWDQSGEVAAGGERKRNARYAAGVESETATLCVLRGPAEGSMPAIHSEPTTRMPVNCSASGMPSKAINSRRTKAAHANTAPRSTPRLQLGHCASCFTAERGAVYGRLASFKFT